MAARANVTELVTYTQRQQPSPKSKSTVRRQNKFVIFPDEWEFQMLRIDADKCAYRLALYLLREAWRSGREHVKVTNVGMTEAIFKASDLPPCRSRQG